MTKNHDAPGLEWKDMHDTKEEEYLVQMAAHPSDACCGPKGTLPSSKSAATAGPTALGWDRLGAPGWINSCKHSRLSKNEIVQAK